MTGESDLGYGDVSRQLAEFARDCRNARDRELPKLMRRAVRESVRPIGEAMKSNARVNLPQRGGLAAYVGSSRIGTRIVTGSNSAGVRLIMKRPKDGGLVDLNSIERRGVVRHPVFGERSTWASTQVSPDSITGDLETEIAAARDRMSAAIAEMAGKLARGVSGVAKRRR